MTPEQWAEAWWCNLDGYLNAFARGNAMTILVVFTLLYGLAQITPTDLDDRILGAIKGAWDKIRGKGNDDPAPSE
jgi:hypothetical protein